MIETREHAEAILDQACTIPGEACDLTMAICVAVERDGWKVLSDEGVFTVALLVRSMQLRTARAELERREPSPPSADVVVFPGAVLRS